MKSFIHVTTKPVLNSRFKITPKVHFMLPLSSKIKLSMFSIPSNFILYSKKTSFSTTATEVTAESQLTIDLATIQTKHESGEVVKATDSDLFNALCQSRDLFVINSWLTEKPESNIKTYKTLNRSLNRSHELARWYELTKLKFSKFNEMPKWVMYCPELHATYLDSDSGAALQYKQSLAQVQSSKDAEIDRYKTAMARIQISENLLTKKLIIDNPLLAINKITPNVLPIECVERHADLTGKSWDTAMDLELTAYRQTLGIRYLNENLTSSELETIFRGKAEPS